MTCSVILDLLVLDRSQKGLQIHFGLTAVLFPRIPHDKAHDNKAFGSVGFLCQQPPFAIRFSSEILGSGTPLAKAHALFLILFDLATSRKASYIEISTFMVLIYSSLPNQSSGN